MRLYASTTFACVLVTGQAGAQGQLGVEAGLGLVESYLSTKLDDEPREATGLGLSAGAFWLQRVVGSTRQSLSLGPHLGSLLHVGGPAYPLYVDVDLAGALVFENAGGGPRLVFGLGPSWNAGRRIRSFEVEQEAGSAFGVHGYLGYGMGFQGARGELLVETRLEAREWFTHERTMTDRRTGETVTLDEESGSFGMTIYAVYAFGM